MGSQLDEVRRKLLLGAKPISLLCGDFQVARTPAGPGLAAYMSLMYRRRVTIWDKLVAVDAELPQEEQDKIIEGNNQIINTALRENQLEDNSDLVEALYWSIARVDPTIERAALLASIDNTNQTEIFTLLVEVNTLEHVAPNVTTPPEATGMTTEQPSTQTTGATD